MLCSCSFFPLLPPLPSSPSSRLTPAAAAALAPGKPCQPGGKHQRLPDSFLSAFTPFPQLQQQMGGERTVLRTEKTLWRNLCRFFLGWFVQWFLNAARGKEWAGTGDRGQADVLGGILWGEAAGCHRWRVLASSPGSGQTGRAVLSRCRQRDLQDMGDFLSRAGTPLTESSQNGAWWCECWLGLTWRCSRG